MIAALLLCVAPVVVDGDTIRCSGVGRVRMVAIDTPDKTTSAPCRGHFGNHVCDNAQSALATAKLRDFVTGKRITYRIIVPSDRYGRPVAQMFAGRTDLQCYQLRAKVARYIKAYDTSGTIARRCPIIVLAAD